MSQRKVTRHFGISREGVRKALALSMSSACWRTVPVELPKLDGYTETIDGWSEDDGVVPRHHRHTAKRVFDRLRDEHGFIGGYTTVKDYIRERGRPRGGRCQVEFLEPGRVVA